MQPYVRPETINPPLAELLRLDDAAFRKHFAGTPVKRTGRNRFMRNVLIAAGNSGDVRLMREIEPLITDPSPLVRAMAAWASWRLCGSKRFRETDPVVRAEWDRT